MRRDSNWCNLMVLFTLAAMVMACNLQGTQSQVTQPPAKETLGTPNQPPPPHPTQSPAKPPSAVVTVEGGSGFIFSTQQKSKDDRDVWWNAYELVPDSGRMISLGVISNLGSVKELVFPAKTAPYYEPVVGEGFGVEIKRGATITYAVIRIVKIESDRNITFEWTFPFTGPIRSTP